MDKGKITRLLELIAEAVSAEGKTWQEKRDMIFAEAGDDDRTNLGEFCTWFEGA